MSFNCEQCGKEILDGKDGYFTGCPHYPAVQMMINQYRGNNLMEANGRLMRLDHANSYRKALGRKAVNRILHPIKGLADYSAPKLEEVFREAGYEQAPN